MTKVLKILISGLLIMILSISSLYAIEFKNWYDNYYARGDDYIAFYAFGKQGETNINKALFGFMSKIDTNNYSPVFIINIPKRIKLKKYQLGLFDGFGYNDITNADFLENGSEYLIRIQLSKEFYKTSASSSYLSIGINNKYYAIGHNELVYPYYLYNNKLQREEQEKSLEQFKWTLETPTKEEIEQYQKKVIMSNDLNDRYINIYNNYASEATKMGLNGAFQKDLYFLHRYVKQTTFNPENVYNVMVGDLAIDNIKQNKKILVYVRKNGSPFRVSFNDGEKEHVINSYVFVDFAFNSGGSKQLQESHEKGFLNSMATIPYFYIMSGNKRVYLYRRDSFAYYYILLYDKVIKVSLY